MDYKFVFIFLLTDNITYTIDFVVIYCSNIANLTETMKISFTMKKYHLIGNL